MYPIAGIPIRTDHLVTYILIPILVILKYKLLNIKKIIIAEKKFLSTIIIFILFTLTVTLVKIPFYEINFIKILSFVDDYFQIIIIMLSANLYFTNLSSNKFQEVKNSLVKININFILLNIIIQLYFFYTGCTSYLLLISGAKICGLGAADMALLGGRSAGVIDQIITGGFAYCIILTSLIYALIKFNNKKYAVTFFVIFIMSGILLGSKLLYVIGFGGFLYFLVIWRIYKHFITKFSILIYLVSIIIISWTIIHWDGAIPITRGLIYITRLIDPFADLFIKFIYNINALDVNVNVNVNKGINLNETISIFSSGRVNVDETIKYSKDIIKYYNNNNYENNINKIYQLLFGGGLKTRLPIDNGFREIITSSGILGLCLYFLFIYQLLKIKTKNHLQKLLCLFLIITLVVGTTGTSLITSNRIFAMFYITYLIYSIDSKIIKL